MSIFQSLVRKIHAIDDEIKDRQTRRELAQLSPEILRDIGLKDRAERAQQEQSGTSYFYQGW